MSAFLETAIVTCMSGTKEKDLDDRATCRTRGRHGIGIQQLKLGYDRTKPEQLAAGRVPERTQVDSIG